jgi:hypothetical protein
MARYKPGPKAKRVIKLNGQRAIYEPHEQQVLLDLISQVEEGSETARDEIRFLHRMKCELVATVMSDEESEAWEAALEEMPLTDSQRFAIMDAAEGTRDGATKAAAATHSSGSG